MSEPLPTADELREASRRGITVYALRLERGGTSKPKARRMPTVPRYRQPHGTGERHGDTFCAVLYTTPRSKKNGYQIVYRKNPKTGLTRPHRLPSEAYLAYAAEVETAIMGLRAKCHLPLPSIPLALSVVFFTPDDRADVDNLVVGLNDALQDAGVFGDDRMVRTITASAEVDAENPRVAFTLSPAEP